MQGDGWKGTLPPAIPLPDPTTRPQASRLDAPITLKTFLMCAFASFGGIFFGYDSGYISGVMDMPFFIQLITGLPIPGPDASDAVKAAFTLRASQKSLITSILSAGTFFGALMAGDLADWFGRRATIVAGCAVFILGVVLQTASHGVGLLVAGRLVAGLGVGFVSATIILYMSEIAPKKVRGALVSGYQFCITIGIMLASCVTYATQNRADTGSYRIPIGVQMAWAVILATGLIVLPESPRYYVKKGNVDRAANVLARLRGQPEDSEYVLQELTEIIANNEYELSVMPGNGYFESWQNCFRGGLSNPSSNLRRTILGTSLQMMQQMTGINFIFYFGTTFFQELKTISNPFLISIVTTLVNVCSTPISFYTIERFGRRTILIYGALGMLVCEFIVAIVGVTAGAEAKHNHPAVSSQIALICIYISFFASTWGPGAWVLVGEIFPLPIRARGVALSTASNWLWNCIIAVITPYMVGSDHGEANLQSRVFFIWGALCTACLVYSYALVPETKGLSLEQVDRMLEESNPRNSANWVPCSKFAAGLGHSEVAAAEAGQGEKVEAQEVVVQEV